MIYRVKATKYLASKAPAVPGVATIRGYSSEHYLKQADLMKINLC